jgi:hypothetical protein
MINFDSPKASAKGASVGLGAVAAAAAAPMVVVASPKAASASPSPSPKAAAKGASAPMTIVPSSEAATSLPALRKALEDATQMLAVRKAIAVREALAARSARTNDLPSAAEKNKEALAARSNFRDVKALVEKLSARVAAAKAPAPMVVGAVAKGISSKGAKGAAAKAPAPMVVKAAPVILNVSSRNKWSSSSDGSPKKKTKKIKFSIKSLEKEAAPAPIVIVESPKGSIKGLSGVKFGPAATAAKERGSVFKAPVISPKGKSSDSWSRNIGLGNISKVVDKLDWEESPKAAAAAPAPIVVVKSPKAASPKAASPKAASPKAAAAAPKAAAAAPKAAWRKSQAILLSEMPDDIAEFRKEHLKAFGAAAMGRQTLRKKTDLLEGLDLAKQPEKKGNKTRRLERYERLLREGRITEARRYMKSRKLLNEVMANLVPVENIKPEVLNKLGSPSKKGSPLGLRKKSSNSEPEHNFDLEVVNIDDNFGSPSKKRSSSKSRKRASAKPSGSSQSRKVGTGASFGKMAEALEEQAKQDAKQGVAFNPAPFSPKATYVIGLGSPANGKKGKHDISALHKKVVNLATSPTFKPHDPKKGVPFKPVPFSPKATYVIGLRGSADGKKGKHDISALHKKVVNPATSPTFNPYDPKNGKWMG